MWSVWLILIVISELSRSVFLMPSVVAVARLWAFRLALEEAEVRRAIWTCFTPALGL